MPGKYRIKSCLNCGKQQRMRNNFCSQACSNTFRAVSDNVRDNMRKVSLDYHRTPEAIAKKKLMNTPLIPEDFSIEIPNIVDITDIPEGYDIADEW